MTAVTRCRSPVLVLVLLAGVTLVAIPVAAAAAAPGVAVQISAGGYHSCAITPRERLKCWGNNDYGQVGIGASTDDEFKPVLVPDLKHVKKVAVGGDTSCAILSGGALKCWGYNAQGQVGDGTHETRRQPTQVKGMRSGVKMVSVGYRHTCAAMLNGKVKCWGSNVFGALGIGTFGGERARPQLVRTIHNASRVSAGADFTCAAVNEKAKCWGRNHLGQLGDGTKDDRRGPRQVKGLDHAVKEVTAGYLQACAIVNAGRLKCWGSNPFGELGIGSTGGDYDRPQNVQGMAHGVSHVAADYRFTCAVKRGAAKCFGSNGFYQLGTGDPISSDVPVQVSGLTKNVVGIDVGFEHGCALLKSGAERCWARNQEGQVGINNTVNLQVRTPQRVLL